MADVDDHRLLLGSVLVEDGPAWAMLMKRSEKELLIQILWQLVNMRQEQKDHWKHMHSPELDKERDDMMKQLIGNIDAITKPFKDEQEEWNKKLGKDKK